MESIKVYIYCLWQDMSRHIKSVTLNGIVCIHRVRHTVHPVRCIEHPVLRIEHPVHR